MNGFNQNPENTFQNEPFKKNRILPDSMEF